MTLSRRTPLPRGNGLKRNPENPLKRGGGLRRTPFHRKAAPKAKAARRDTIPPRVRRTVARRDEWSCARCGSMRDLHQHHRRIKGHGGDTRPHTDCACNIVVLCLTCHDWAHKAGRAVAEAQGLVVPRGTLLPGSVRVVLHGGAVAWLTCDGKRVTAEPGQVAA